MNFDIRSFVMQGLIAAIGIQSDYWVILEAARWYEKGVLKDGDLQLITEKIEQKNTSINDNIISMEDNENEIPFEENEIEENIDKDLEEQDME